MYDYDRILLTLYGYVWLLYQIKNIILFLKLYDVVSMNIH